MKYKHLYIIYINMYVFVTVFLCCAYQFYGMPPGNTVLIVMQELARFC